MSRCVCVYNHVIQLNESVTRPLTDSGRWTSVMSKLMVSVTPARVLYYYQANTTFQLMTADDGSPLHTADNIPLYRPMWTSPPLYVAGKHRPIVVTRY